MSLDSLAWNDDELVAVIAQDAETGEVRMMAYADREAVKLTLQTGLAHFFSRSRRALWKKGESSGNIMKVREVWADCDGDALLYLVDPEGPSCHTGAETCFFRRVDDDGEIAAEDSEGAEVAAPTMLRLERTLRSRAESTADKSYTKSLLDAGAPKIGDKVREEANEFSNAIAAESETRVASEAGDTLYHLLVGLLLRDVSLRDVFLTLSKRSGQSGHEEKASR